MIIWLAIALGGALGALTRYGVSQAVLYAAVSVAGSVLIFMLAIQMMRSFGGAG
ncbi:MAG: hypothetical protein ISQ21_09320 [Alphaproteobacteria bacterium]|nr:hypothetical protein [Alphaproteobacteria bacterium]